MTSGPTKIPPQQLPGQPAPAKPPGEPNVLLEKLPAELSDVKKAIEIKGRVIQENRDGSLDIRTEKGDVRAKPERGLNVRTGDDVEIEIPPGRPPQNARVTAETEIQIPRTTQTPVNVEVRPTPPPEIAQPIPVTLSEGQVVRLQPVPAQEASQYVPPAETVAAILPEIIAARAELGAQAVQDALAAAIVAPPLNNATIPTAIFQPITPPPVAPQTDVQLIKPPLIPNILSNDLNVNASIPALTMPTQAVPSTMDSFISNIPGFAALRAQISALNAMPSPAIVTPKIPPSPVISPETLAKIFDKPMILQNQKAGEMSAVVTGFTPQKLPVISLFNPLTGEESFFIMHAPGGAIVPGTQVTLVPQQPLQNATPITATVTFAPMSPAWFLAPEPWPLMDDIYQTLAQIMPRAAQAMSNMTPSPQNPANLGPAALFFIAAVRAGDLSQWLGGGAVDALKRGGKSGLLNRLGMESSSLNRLASDPVAQDWRALSLPMMFDNQMHKIALYYKNESEREQKDPQGRQTRFIFDLSLDMMGKVQLDGLFRAKRLDLIVRTLTPFSQPMQQEMRRLYAGALGDTQIIGDLSFQNNPAQWVTITPEAKNLGVSV
jgi:hypothetical protein